MITNEDQSLVELWVIADKLSITSLQNAALETLEQIRVKTDSTPTDCIRYVDGFTASDSLLRKYFVEAVGSKVSAAAIRDNSYKYPPGFLLDLVLYYAEKYDDVEDIDVSDFLVPVDQEDKDD